MRVAQRSGRAAVGARTVHTRTVRAHRTTDAALTFPKGGPQVKDDRKARESKTAQARARRSRQIRAFLDRWGRRHMPERVTRFPSR